MLENHQYMALMYKEIKLKEETKQRDNDGGLQEVEVTCAVSYTRVCLSPRYRSVSSVAGSSGHGVWLALRGNQAT
jgi:hypothetical protein